MEYDMEELKREISRISEYQTFLHEIIPLKFKKHHPSQDENPYYTLEEVRNNSDLFQAAKERMKNFLEGLKVE